MGDQLIFEEGAIIRCEAESDEGLYVYRVDEETDEMVGDSIHVNLMFNYTYESSYANWVIEQSIQLVDHALPKGLELKKIRVGEFFDPNDEPYDGPTNKSIILERIKWNDSVASEGNVLEYRIVRIPDAD